MIFAQEGILEKAADFFETTAAHNTLVSVIFGVALVLVTILYNKVADRLRARALRTPGRIDDFVVDLFRLPALLLIVWIMLKVFSENMLEGTKYAAAVSQGTNIVLIALIGWILIKFIKLLFYYLEHKLNVVTEDNIEARGNLTKLKLFEDIAISFITVLVVAGCLMTFDKVRTVGVSILTTAGVAGIILGLAAQKSISLVMAGIQIAITQPIRLDDVVVVEGEWGRIEEITMTYVVVNIWDQRRLILPATYFLEKPFQNWTRRSADLLGTVFLYVDYKLPLEPLREELQKAVENNADWDHRLAKIQVTDMKPQYMELRVLVSTRNSSTNWELRVAVRERLTRFIAENYPDCLVHTRLGSADAAGDIPYIHGDGAAREYHASGTPEDDNAAV